MWYMRIGTQVELSSDTPLGISQVLNILTFPPTCIKSLCSVKVYIGKVRERVQGSTVQGSAVTLKGNITHYKNKLLFVRFGFQSHMQSTVIQTDLSAGLTNVILFHFRQLEACDHSPDDPLEGP